MTTFKKLIILLSIGMLLTACQSSSVILPEVAFEDGELRQHHLSLVKAAAKFDKGTLTLSGGVWPEHKQVHVKCGQIQFQVFDTQGVLLKTIVTDYSPCHLHFKPNTRRTGSFSVVINDIHPQALIIKASYQKCRMRLTDFL